MQHSVDRPGLPYGAILTHGYPPAIYVVMAGIASFILGFAVGIFQ